MLLRIHKQLNTLDSFNSFLFFKYILRGLTHHLHHREVWNWLKLIINDDSNKTHVIKCDVIRSMWLRHQTRDFGEWRHNRKLAPRKARKTKRKKKNGDSKNVRPIYTKWEITTNQPSSSSLSKFTFSNHPINHKEK